MHAASRGTYGARRIHAARTLGLGLTVGHNQIEARCRAPTSKAYPGPDGRNLDIRHRQPATWPTRYSLGNNQIGCGPPITEHHTREGKVFCAVVLDGFSRRVIGWLIDSSQTSARVTNALSMAISNRAPLEGTAIHSNRPRGAIHVVDMHRSSQTIRSRSLHGICRRLPRQHHNRIILGQNANRTSESKTMAHPDCTLRTPSSSIWRTFTTANVNIRASECALRKSTNCVITRITQLPETSYADSAEPRAQQSPRKLRRDSG